MHFEPDFFFAIAHVCMALFYMAFNSPLSALERLCWTALHFDMALALYFLATPFDFSTIAHNRRVAGIMAFHHNQTISFYMLLAAILLFCLAYYTLKRNRHALALRRAAWVSVLLTLPHALSALSFQFAMV